MFRSVHLFLVDTAELDTDGVDEDFQQRRGHLCFRSRRRVLGVRR